jgi:glutaconate CoA-transferase subunit A
VLDATCPAVYAGLQAGAKGQPFAPLRGLIGTDLLRHRPDYRVIDNPIRARRPRSAVVPAINTDLALFHAARPTAEGNVWIGRDRDRLLAAHAANTVLVTVDAIVPGSFFDDEAGGRRRGPGGQVHRRAGGGARAAAGPWMADGRTDLARCAATSRPPSATKALPTPACRGVVAPAARRCTA